MSVCLQSISISTFDMSVACNLLVLKCCEIPLGNRNMALEMSQQFLRISWFFDSKFVLKVGEDGGSWDWGFNQDNVGRIWKSFRGV